MSAQMARGDVSGGKATLQRAVDAMPRSQHADVLSKFAQLEFKFGEAERGRTVFDSTFRVLCATLFPRHLEQIFALTRFGEGLSAAVLFSICPCRGGTPVAAILLVIGAVALAGYWLAEHLNGYGRPAEERGRGCGFACCLGTRLGVRLFEG